MLKSQVYPGNQRNIQDRGTMSHSFGVDMQTSQFERMKRFQHHTEQQMQRMSQEPKQTEYENCIIQPVNDSDSVHDNSASSFLSPSLYSGTPSLHLSSDSFLKDTFPRVGGYGRVRSQAFSVDSHPSSIQEPVFSNRKAFTKEKLSLQKSRRHIEQDSDDSSVKAPHDKKKKRRRFGISIFGKKKTSRGEVSSDSDSSSDPKPSRTAGESARPRGGLGVSLPSPTKNSKNSSVIPAGNATSVSNSMSSMSSMGPMSSKNSMNSMSSMSSIGPMGVSRGLGKPSKEFHTEDLENLRRKVMQQKQEIEQLVETGKLMQAELGRSRAEHRKNLKELTRLASGNRSSLKAMEKGLLERKRQQENQLTESLLSHYRSTVEDQVTDVQRRLTACNNRRRNVMESTNSPVYDFVSRLLAYAVAGFTVVCSVFVYLYIFLQSYLGLSYTRSITN